MQNIVVEKPYTFIPPRHSRGWHWLVRLLLPRYIKKTNGVAAVECVGAEKLRASLDAGHGIMIVSNHCRPCDPMVLDSLAAEVERPFHVIASWHAFMFNKIRRFIMPRVGAFSVYREGMDRESLKCSVKTVADARHPLVIFAEGIITRSNDRLVNFMDGPSFIARSAAKQRTEGKVVIHPVFIRYFFEGDLEKTVMPVIGDIEKRLAWQPQIHLPLRERILKIGGALLDLKEIEHLHSPQSGTIRERLQRLEDFLLAPLEIQWCGGRHDGDTMARVKRLRSAILPQMVTGDLTETERASPWRQLADLYLVQQLHCYPGDYFENATPERILETVERYEEDLTDVARPHFPIRAVITVGDAIEVGAGRDKSQDTDPVTAEIRRRMEELLESSKNHRRIAPTGAGIP
ncbi:1-acyl-sn-glycerol-3-phosphate acyltransferase [Luteolibacter yonseiensis]|uniref:1-acyl-sn-glycerol-3-phosphate acyltransferase n=1 Tax=Luteolibacter yonseiensis TaxID=1144680 RepID=A0A934V9A2_9BACT|nr:1-acyl-sn-glycerol-3-phosphate acyltransferase [Luteolibacter yonseiensis]MBK1814928.1 1-acyl-sn-glycerol-3-phosphate acyltransferase [Luteolibacter yonseiensis]